jgi:PAS domain S-box-containing protein
VIGDGNHEKASPDATANVQLLDLVLAPLQETVLITDDHGTLVYISPNVDTIFGYTRDDLMGQETLERVFGGRVVDYDELHRVGAVQNIERTVLDKAGGAHILLINVRFVQILHGTSLFSCVDITKRMEEEELLRASEARFRLMAENSNDILIFYRLEPAMRIEYITPTVTSIFGYTPEDFYANQNVALVRLGI